MQDRKERRSGDLALWPDSHAYAFDAALCCILQNLFRELCIAGFQEASEATREGSHSEKVKNLI